MKSSAANAIETINHPEALIGGGGNLRELLKMTSNQNMTASEKNSTQSSQRHRGIFTRDLQY